MQYDYIVVGSGLYGAVFAQQAREAGKSALVIEKRSHIGGNCYSEAHEDTNILVHRYGTHIFHTNSEEIWRYVNRFTEFNRYQHRVLTTHRGRVFAMPINLGTINQFYGLNLMPGEVEAFMAAKRAEEGNRPGGGFDTSEGKPRNLEEKAISLIGRDLYEAFIKGYTTKQWGCDPRELPAAIITRLPVRDSYFDSYFDDRYQGIPVEGYTPIFERLLEGTPVERGVDFFEDPEHWRAKAKRVVYTGPIDRYFEFAHGRLGWRSVRFETQRLDVADYQGTSVMNFADTDVAFTRIHEPKHLHREKAHRPENATVIVKEFSHQDDDAPYYPIAGEADRERYAKYKALAESDSEKRTIFGGRLAEYKYYDMHQVIGSALARARVEIATPGARHA